MYVFIYLFVIFTV